MFIVVGKSASGSTDLFLVAEQADPLDDLSAVGCCTISAFFENVSLVPSFSVQVVTVLIVHFDASFKPLRFSSSVYEKKVSGT